MVTLVQQTNFDILECADCVEIHGGTFYRHKEQIEGKNVKYSRSNWWWLCEACALARGWIW